MIKRKKDKGKVRNTEKNVDKLKYDNIQFRSSLEVYCYKALKKANLEANYETEVFELIPKFTLIGKWLESLKTGLKLSSGNVQAMTYTPDFISNDKSWLIECKGYTGADIWQVKRKLIKNYVKNMNINIYVPSTQKQIDEVIQLILNENK